jgi:hypothetical protein
MNYRIKEPKQVVLHAQGGSGAGLKQWVGLTDEEIDAAWRSVDYTVPYNQFRIDVAREIESKLKEKNGG